MTVSIISLELLILLIPKLVWLYIIIISHSGFSLFKVKVTAKVKNVIECLSRWYLHCGLTFCNKMWYGDASWAGVLCKSIHLPASRSSHNEGSCNYNISLFLSSGLLILLWPNSFDHTSSQAGVSCEKVILLCSRSRSQWWLKTSLMFLQFCIFMEGTMAGIK